MIHFVRKLISFSAILVLTSCGQNKGVAPGSSSAGQNSNSSTPPCTMCKIFVTALDYDGNLGGTSGADAKCMADARKPDSSTYKAMISASNRLPPSTDWVLKPNTIYLRASDSAAITTSTAGSIFIFNLNNGMSGLNQFPWTGLSATFTLDPETCQDWTSNSTLGYGMAGRATTFNSTAIHLLGTACDQLLPLYCVEQ